MNKTCTLQYKDKSSAEIFRIKKNADFIGSREETDAVELSMRLLHRVFSVAAH